MTSRDEIFSRMVAAGPKGSHKGLAAVLALMVVVGTAAFVAGALGPQAVRAWEAYLTNFVFWTGLAFGGVLFSAILTLTNARWGRPIKRLAESMSAFLPVAFVLFWVLYPGREILFSWIHEPIPAKAAWLNAPFLFIRDSLALLVLGGVGLAIVYHSVRRDLKAIEAGGLVLPVQKEEMERLERPLVSLSVIYAILYAFIMSLLAFDLIMSLSPHWYSTLFGAYYFMGSFYTGLALLVVLSTLAVWRMGLERFILPGQFHDLGKLMMAFCLVTADFFFTQFLVMWYGNLPEETEFIIKRAYLQPWKPVAITVAAVCFGLPFLTLLSRQVKMRPKFLVTLASIIMIGMWIEKFFLVAPSLWTESSIPLGVMEVLITAGFSGAVGLCVLGFLKRFPVIVVGDPLLHEHLRRAGVEGEAGGHPRELPVGGATAAGHGQG